MDFDTAVLDTSEHDCLDHTLGFEMGALYVLFASRRTRLVVVLHDANKGRALRLAERMGWRCSSWMLCGTEVTRGAFMKGREHK